MYAENVTPLVGVWIEIDVYCSRLIADTVTPLVGVWIEIAWDGFNADQVLGHSPRGSVD